MIYILCSLICFVIAAIYKNASDEVNHTRWTTIGFITFIFAFLFKIIELAVEFMGTSGHAS